MIEFPIVPAYDQQFAAFLNRRRVTIRLRYNNLIQRWAMDLSIDNLPVLKGRKVVPGVDLISAFDFDIGMIVAWPDKGAMDAEPTYEALTKGAVRLYYVGEEEYLAAIST